MTAVRLRPTLPDDLPYVTALERHPANRELIGQWSDEEHLAAIRREAGREHWIIERGSARAGYLIAYDCRRAGAGIYVKRILIEEKNAGTGRAALAAFLDEAFARPGVDAAWLIVRNGNARARKVYESLGFARFEPRGEEATRYDAVAEAPMDECFRMRSFSPRSRAR